MVTISEITAKSIISKSGIPGAEYVINPYVGCAHRCLYCYARFMLRFTGHTEPWGRFVDVKVNGAELVPQKPGRYHGASLLMSSVTDAYQPLEQKYKLTRRILERLIPLQPELSVITKSDLVTRDLDLLTRFKDTTVTASMSTPDDALARELEPGASPPSRRLAALKTLHDAGIGTVVFVSPILPGITDWKGIIEQSRDFIDEYWFENLNLYPAVRDQLFPFLARRFPDLINNYRAIYSAASTYWYQEERAIREFCRVTGTACSIYFHHRRR